MLPIGWRTVVLCRVQKPPICADFWHRTYCHYFNSSSIGPNDLVIQNKWETVCFLHVWVFPRQIAYASAQLLEPAGCGDVSLSIMQTKRSIMDHKCHVTKTRASVTGSTGQREWVVRLKAPRAGIGYLSWKKWKCFHLKEILDSEVNKLQTRWV